MQRRAGYACFTFGVFSLVAGPPIAAIAAVGPVAVDPAAAIVAAGALVLGGGFAMAAAWRLLAPHRRGAPAAVLCAGAAGAGAALALAGRLDPTAASLMGLLLAMMATADVLTAMLSRAPC